MNPESTERHTGRISHDDRNKDWNDTSTSQGTQEVLATPES